MAVAILLTLIFICLTEIAIFVLVGDAIGVWRTVALVFLSILAGILVLRVQSVMTLVRVREALHRGETPAAELFNGACRLAAGILLVVPGFLTDVLGLLLLLRPVREILRRFLGRRIAGRTSTRVWTDGETRRPSGSENRRPKKPGPLIEGDFEEVPTREDDHQSGRRPDGETNGDGETRR